MNEENILTISGITFGYTQKSPILEGVNLEIRRGHFVGLLGPTGSGKTTLIKIIIGLIKPWHGTVILSKNSPSRTSKITVGYVPQVEGVDWNFPITVREVVAMGIWNQSGIAPWLPKNAKEEVDRILTVLGIGDFGSRQIRDLSGGEQQRIFIARALIRNPDILILDEPASGVDHVTREKILGNLNDLNSLGMTIILTTHDLSGIAKRLPWVVCMNGTVIAEGKPEDTLTDKVILRTYGLVDTVPTGRD